MAFSSINFIGIWAIFAVIALMWFGFIRLYDDTVIIPKLVILSLYLLLGSLFVLFFPNLGVLSQVILVAGLSLFFYFSLLAVNVHVVVSRIDENIPLLQPAIAVSFMTIVLTVFLGTTVIYKLPFFLEEGLVNLGMKGLFFVIFFQIVLFRLSWIFGENNRVGQIPKSAVNIGKIGLPILAIALTLFPFEDLGRGMFLATVSYIILNFTSQYLHHDLKKSFWIESIGLITAIYTLIYLL